MRFSKRSRAPTCSGKLRSSEVEGFDGSCSAGARVRTWAVRGSSECRMRSSNPPASELTHHGTKGECVTRECCRIFCALLLSSALAAMACGGGGGSTPTSPTPPGGGSGGGGGGGGTTTNTITIGSNGAVSPNSITVAVGSQVTFVNNSNRPHDMNSDPHPEHTECPALNVGFIQPGQSRQSQNLTVVRTCGFHDHNEPSNTSLMGTVRIQ
jgi:hypothetical protein